MAQRPRKEKVVVDITGGISKGFNSAVFKARKSLDQLKGAITNLTNNPFADFAKSYISAVDNIKKGTGAFGRSIQPLKENLNNLIGETSLALPDLSSAVADVNTYMGLNGKELENMVKQVSHLASLTNADAKSIIESSSKVQKRWNLNSTQLMKYNEAAWQASMATGKSIDALNNDMQRYSETLTVLGLNETEAISLLSLMTQKGIDVDKTMRGLSQQTNMTTREMSGFIDNIRNAKTEEEALNIASTQYNREIAPEMVKFYRLQNTELENVNKSLTTNVITSEQAEKQTRSLSATWEMATQQISKGLIPVTDKLLELLNWFNTQDGKRFTQAISWLLEKVIKVGEVVFKGIASDLTIIPKLFYGKEGVLSIIEDKKNVLKTLGEVVGITDNEKKLPQKAMGGWVYSPSICGEAGPEAVISMNPAYRDQNIKTWAEAGQALGVSGVNVNINGMSFSPTINGAQNTDILGELRSQSREFAQLVAGAINANIQRSF